MNVGSMVARMCNAWTWTQGMWKLYRFIAEAPTHWRYTAYSGVSKWRSKNRIKPFWRDFLRVYAIHAIFQTDTRQQPVCRWTSAHEWKYKFTEKMKRKTNDDDGDDVDKNNIILFSWSRSRHVHIPVLTCILCRVAFAQFSIFPPLLAQPGAHLSLLVPEHFISIPLFFYLLSFPCCQFDLLLPHLRKLVLKLSAGRGIHAEMIFRLCRFLALWCFFNKFTVSTTENLYVRCTWDEMRWVVRVSASHRRLLLLVVVVVRVVRQ